MDQNEILYLMAEAFKSLTVSQIEIVELSTPLIKVRVVAESYASKSIPERVEVLTILLRKSSAELSLNYAISFEPLTPTEYSDWYGSGKGRDTTESDSGMAALEIEP